MNSQNGQQRSQQNGTYQDTHMEDHFVRSIAVWAPIYRLVNVSEEG